MLRIGLTGGIGSGKTTVARIFEVLGVHVYYADDAAKKLMNEDEEIREKIIHHFGPESYVDGKLNRPFLAKEIFSDPEKTKIINSIIHPATIADAEKWMNAQSAPYAIKEAALIFEAHAEKNLDLIIGVTAPVQIRMNRVMQRDKISELDFFARAEKQLNESEKMSRCDIIIHNDEQGLLIPKVVAVHENIMRNIERVHN